MSDMQTDTWLAAMRTDGYIVVENFLSPDEIAASRKLLADVYPSWEDFTKKPNWFEEVTGSPTTHWALKQFPTFPAELHLNVLKPELIEFAKAFIGDDDVMCDQSAISGKYAGHHTEDQDLHADYGNHTIAFPDERYLAGMLYYVDVTVDNGATWIVSRKHTSDAQLVPHHRSKELDPALYEHQRPVEGPAGTLLLYTLKTFHRGAAFLAEEGVRFNHHFCYRPSRVPWSGWSSWPMQGNAPEMHRLIQMCTTDQRSAMGFPPPGDPFWNESTLAGTAARFPDLDMTPYR